MECQLHSLLLDEIKKRQPKSQEIVHVLMKTLSLGREAAYRRMRGDVPFTLQEAAIIAKKYAISLDELIGVDLERCRSLRLRLPNFIDPDENGRFMFTDFVDFFESISRQEATETGVVTNALPQDLFSKYDLIIKLNVFRWQYYSAYEKRVSFNDLHVSEVVLDTLREQYRLARNLKETIYVFDRRIFLRLIREIEYFRYIALIDAQSVEAIKGELLLLIDYLEEMAVTGVFPETGNKVQLYITEMEVPFSCTYIKAEAVEYTLMKAFLLTSITSFDKEIFKRVKDWVFSSIQTATLITQSSEMERIAFFTRQRELVAVL